jgi:ketosteroid isomerase-like protein
MPVEACAEVARRAWDAIARGDADALRKLLAPELVWHATARGAPWSGRHQGADQILDFLAGVGETTDVFDAQLVDVLASEARVCVVFHVRLQALGRRLELDYLLLGRVARGCFEEIWTVPLDPAGMEALWSDIPLAGA